MLGTDLLRGKFEKGVSYQAFVASGELWDDGIIDPRDTRTVLGIALSAAMSEACEGSGRFGVFRM